MKVTRRHVLAGAIAAPALIKMGGSARAATTLKISHQFPGGTIDEGDFRDRLVRKFAAGVEKATNGELKFDIYPNSSLMKTVAQFSAMRKGALDISLYPLPYAGGELPETNIGLMPGLVSTYDQGLRWKNQPVGKALTDFLADKGIIILTWVWQAGGVASRSKPIVTRRRQGPEGARRLARDGHGAADRGRRGAVAALERTLCGDADRRLRRRHHLLDQPDLVPARGAFKHLTTGRGKSYWFMLEPLLMSKSIFDALPKAQQDAIISVGLEMEKFGLEGAKADDIKVAEVYQKAGAKVHDLDAEMVEKWRAIARETAWKDYAAKTEFSANLLKSAQEVTA